VQHCIYGALSFGPTITTAQVKRLARAHVVAAQYRGE